MTLPATAAWTPADNTLTPSKPGQVDTTAKVKIGTIRKFKDNTYGEGEFIYLKGVADTVAGSPVTYNAAFQTVRAAATNSLPSSWAIATGATVANTWGWYQIGGQSPAKKTKTVSFASGIAVAVSTAGLISVSSSLKELQGAMVAVVASATTTTNNGEWVVLMLNRPHGQGRIT